MVNTLTRFFCTGFWAFCCLITLKVQGAIDDIELLILNTVDATGQVVLASGDYLELQVLSNDSDFKLSKDNYIQIKSVDTNKILHKKSRCSMDVQDQCSVTFKLMSHASLTKVIVEYVVSGEVIINGPQQPILVLPNETIVEIFNRLADLEANDPVPGPIGPQGEKGEPGEQGPPGEQGIPGVPGVNGADGVNGVDGVDGRDGVNGVDGIDGIHCWDLNQNRINDNSEDINQDGIFNVFDCQSHIEMASLLNRISYLENRLADSDFDYDGYSVNQGDCDDADPLVYPGSVVSDDCSLSDVTITQQVLDDTSQHVREILENLHASVAGASSVPFSFLDVNYNLNFIGVAFCLPDFPEAEPVGSELPYGCADEVGITVEDVGYNNQLEISILADHLFLDVNVSSDGSSSFDAYYILADINLTAVVQINESDEQNLSIEVLSSFALNSSSSQLEIHNESNALSSLVSVIIPLIEPTIETALGEEIESIIQSSLPWVL